MLAALIRGELFSEEKYEKQPKFEQIDLFTNYEEINKAQEKEEREKRLQKVILDIKDRYGKNSILKGMNFEDGGTMRDRNREIGGHKA